MRGSDEHDRGGASLLSWVTRRIRPAERAELTEAVDDLEWELRTRQ